MRAIAPPVEGQTWISVHAAEPADLANRVLLVAFWSLGCEASLQLLRQLEALTHQMGNQVEAIAVHTPRFSYEDDTEALRSTVIEHRIELPTVHDPEYVSWNRYNPGGWPAVVVIDRSGRVIGVAQGLESLQTVREVVASELSNPDRRQTKTALNNKGRTPSVPTPLSAMPSLVGDGSLSHSEKLPESSLAFPAGLAIDSTGLLVISDTGNDRLLIGTLETDLRTYRPEVEITDIDQPTDVVFANDNLLFVIERGTGSVLRIDLELGAIDVVLDTEVSIPRALLAHHDGSLLVADSGTDRLLRLTGASLTLGTGAIFVDTLVGTGTCGRSDGPPRRAQLAQPVALADTPGGIAFCDAASSNIRLLSTKGSVHTVTGSDFFEWGLVDGPAHSALLQRPGGLTCTPDGTVFVADTGNNRIRVLENRRLTTLGLGGLQRPTALETLASGHLVVADTGNNRVVIADPGGKTAWPLSIYPAALTSVWAE